MRRTGPGDIQIRLVTDDDPAPIWPGIVADDLNPQRKGAWFGADDAAGMGIQRASPRLFKTASLPRVMRQKVRAWLEELGYGPTDGTDAARGDDWAWNVVLAPGGLEVSIIARTGQPNVIVEAFVTLGLEALGSRRGADAAHRVRAAIQRPRGRHVETEIHRNGKAWLRSTLGAEEIGKAALAQRLRAVQEEHEIIAQWVMDALATGALPR